MHVRLRCLTALATLGLLVGLLPGCGAAIRGHWVLERAIPNADAFALDDARFYGDGQYSARVTLEGRTREEVGTWDYKKLKLHVWPAGGGQRVYEVTISPQQLTLHDSQKRKVVLRRVND